MTTGMSLKVFLGSKKNIAALLLAVSLVVLVSFWWGFSHLNTLVQARLKVLIGADISVGNVSVRWNRVELDKVRIARRGAGPFTTRVSCERIIIRPSLGSLFSGRLDITELLLDTPYLLAEINPDGSFATILPPLTAAPDSTPAAVLPVHLATVRITNGTIDFLDWQVARKSGVGLSNPREHYHLTRLENVSFTAGSLSVPLSEQQTPMQLALSSATGGRLNIAGTFAPKNFDSHLKLDLTGLNIIPYRPYFLERGDVALSAGKLSATCLITINKGTLNIPGTLQLQGLTFGHSTTKETLMGMPAWAVVSFLSDNKDLLSVPFAVSGSLDNPRFSVQQSLTDQIATALSAKIGVPTVSGVGRGILGAGEKGVKGVLGIFGVKK